MLNIHVGQLVWVRTGSGSHEEPATVLNVSSDTKDGERGVLCKFHVSRFETVVPLSNIRAMSTEGRPKRNRDRPAVSPSPLPPHKKAKDHSFFLDNTSENLPKSNIDFVDTIKKHHNKPELFTNQLSKPGKSKSKKQTVEVLDDKESSKIESVSNIDAQSFLVEKNSAKETFDDEIALHISDNSRTIVSGRRQRNSADHTLLENVSVSSEDITLSKLKDQAGKSAKKKEENEIIIVPDEIPLVEADEVNAWVDPPYQVMYSPSNRARCKRCDEVISKGSVRVSHVPLFRGKPGFTIFRHLQCTVFSEEISSAKDVMGWPLLKFEDYNALVKRVEDSKEEVTRENEELDPDELVPVSFQGEMRPPPDGLLAILLPFQVEGVSWMYHQEVNDKSCVRGGMLCDEMGMGKTIQTIATIMDNMPKLQHSMPKAKHIAAEREVRQREDEMWENARLDWEHEMKMINAPKSAFPKFSEKAPGGGFRAGTLIICPVIALSQWKSEIEKFTEAGKLTVGTYHGPDRAKEMPRMLMRTYDIVLTTYQVLEADFRKMTSPNKIKCPNCGGKFKIDRLRVHLKYFCGEGAIRTEAQARQQRNSDRPSNTDNRGGKANGKVNKKQAVQRKSKIDYDSESDLSVVEEKSNAFVGRSSRKASLNARKKMSSLNQELNKEINDRSDDDDYEDNSDEDDSNDDDEQENKAVGKKIPRFAQSKVPPKRDKSEEVSRAMKKQEQALSQFSNSDGNKLSKEAFDKNASKAKGKGRMASKKEKSETNKSDESSINETVDPLDGIDMDALMKEAMDGSKLSPLHSLCWWRIVLDEAHYIKSRSSQTANAAFSLISINRWCLSGTPLQNRVGEFYSLIRFLRIDPMAHYFCRSKGCDCKSLHYRMMNGRCQDCGHASVQHFSHFNKHVLNPIQRSGYTGDGRRAMFTLKANILDECLLRRTKQNRAADMKLPPRLVSIRAIRLHPAEEDFYNALYTQTQASFNDYVDQGTLLNNYAHIFDLLMRMRQAVDHPYLVVYSNRDAKAMSSNGTQRYCGPMDCSICHESPTDVVFSSCCKSALCRGCVQDFLAVDHEGALPCPGCSSPFSIDLGQSNSELIVSDQKNQKGNDPMPVLKDLANVASGSILRRINLAEFSTSSKIEALIEELVAMRESSPGSKAIVFSQFVNMLDLIRWRLHSDPCLKEMGLGVRALHGGMDVKHRDLSLKDFRNDPNVRVLLMSLKAGGVALNLTVANHIYLMDPWWNPAAEMQAIDRTHRLGQYRPIRAIRFIAEDTVEERILQLQEKKRLVFDGTIGRDAGSLKMLTVDDMKALFT